MTDLDITVPPCSPQYPPSRESLSACALTTACRVSKCFSYLHQPLDPVTLSCGLGLHTLVNKGLASLPRRAATVRQAGSIPCPMHALPNVRIGRLTDAARGAIGQSGYRLAPDWLNPRRPVFG